MERLQWLLAHRRSLVCIALLGVLLNVLGLGSPPFTDDFIQWATLTGSLEHTPHTGALFGLFDLVDGSPAQLQAMRDSGRLLWSASESLHLSFWRPVAELTHWLDYKLWPYSPMLMRLHSFLWYGALIYLLGQLYRMLDADRARSGLATLLFALSSLHFFVIMWISARNQLIAGCFCVATLIAYHRWRSAPDGAAYRWLNGWLAALCLALALLSAEAAVATGGYLVAYALCIEHKTPWPQRLRCLMPFLLMIAAWRLTHIALGFGSTHSGSYIDPGLNTRFLHALLQRLPALLMAEVAGISAGIQQSMSDAGASAYAAGAALLLLLLGLLAARWRMWSQPALRFHALGALLALVPVCAVNPTDRVLLASEFGMSAVLAALFWQARARWAHDKGWLAGTAKAALLTLLFVHLALFPLVKLLMPLITDRTLAISSVNEALTLPDDTARPDTHVVLVNPPGPFMLFYYPLIRSYHGRPNPASTQALANGANQALRLSVLDPQTVQLDSESSFVQPIMRDAISQPFKPGDHARMGEVDVRVLRVSDGGAPLSVVFRFPRPLDDPHWAFYVWREPRYERFTLPAVGETVHLASLDLRKVGSERLRRGSWSPPASPPAPAWRMMR